MGFIAIIVWAIILGIAVFGLFAANKSADENHARGTAPRAGQPHTTAKT